MLEQPVLKSINPKEWELVQDYDYTWTEGNTQCRITVRAGFITDLASIPKGFWWMGDFQPWGLHAPAALIHDRLYQHRGRIATDDPQGCYEEFDTETQLWQARDRVFPRAECDALFLRIMREAGESAFTAKTMFYAVRAFGWMAW